jgi:hypothetical protein
VDEPASPVVEAVAGSFQQIVAAVAAAAVVVVGVVVGVVAAVESAVCAVASGAARPNPQDLRMPRWNSNSTWLASINRLHLHHYFR